MLGRRVLVNKAPHDLFSVIKLVKTVSEESRFLEVLDVRLSTLEFVELNAQSVEDASNTGVVGEHHTTHLVRRCHVRTLLRQGYLNRGGTPGYEVGELPLTDALQRLVNLRGIDVSLNDV